MYILYKNIQREGSFYMSKAAEYTQPTMFTLLQCTLSTYLQAQARDSSLYNGMAHHQVKRVTEYI